MWDKLFSLQEVDTKIQINLKDKDDLNEKILLEDGKKAKIVNIDTKHGRIRYEMMFEHGPNDKGKWKKTLGGINIAI